MRVKGALVPGAIILAGIALIGAGILAFKSANQDTNSRKAQSILENRVEIGQSEVFLSKDTVNRYEQNDSAIGLRDFSWLMDESCEVVQYNGEYMAFCNVFTKERFGPYIYMFTSTDGANWIPKRVQIEPTEGVDEEGCSIGSALLVDGEIWIFYAGLTKHEDGVIEYETFNISKSSDGKEFSTAKPLLRSSDFKSINHIGLPYTVYGSDGRLYMTCESISRERLEYDIYGAVSADGDLFVPLNEGEPLLCNDDISWGNGGCANPKLHPLEDGRFLLGMNAFPEESPSGWKIGSALVEIKGESSKVLQIAESPIIDNPGAGRIESAVFVSPQGLFDRIYYFKTPTANATQDATIYTADVMCVG